MSATVTYKGATLTTATNQTRTLDTAGTYLEDDITITDVTTIPTGTKNISITANGTTTEDVTSYASASITANVPNSYTASDEGKVVSNGSLVSQSSATYTENDTYDTTLVDEVTVNVSGGGEWSSNGIADGSEPRGAVTIPTATLINEYAFSHRQGITSITAPSVTQIKQYAFNYGGAFAITATSFPSLTTVDSNAFRNARITSIEITNSTQLLKNSRPFGDNSQLTTALFPNQNGVVGNMCFYSCSRLSVLDVGNATSISANAFNGCPLSALIIRSQSVAALNDTSAFNNTPFKSGGTGGSIYVPSALINSYKSATNWSTINGYGTITWHPIEGSEYEL